MNKRRPWLPQEDQKLVADGVDIEKEIKKAEKALERAEREWHAARKKYQAMMERTGGPFTVEMIALEAQYRRIGRERTAAVSNLAKFRSRKRIGRP